MKPMIHSDLTISFKDVSYKIGIPSKRSHHDTLLTPWMKLVDSELRDTVDFYRIKNISGVIKPGTMTLVISPPGGGKSSYLKVLSDRIVLQSGRIVYNGRDIHAAYAEGIDVKKLSTYCDQIDSHLPLLTVRETIEFAHQMTSPTYDPQLVDEVIRMLGLEECQDIVIGDQYIRGISGGQKRRVSLGTHIVHPGMLFLDEWSNGLDTATAEDIGRALQRIAHTQNKSIVCTLQQPSPGLYELFDQIVVLREGEIVFDGPRADVVPYFEAMGFHANTDVDVCDFIIDVLSDPRAVINRQTRNKEILAKLRKPDISGPSDCEEDSLFLISTGDNLVPAPCPCITTEQMASYYKTTPIWMNINVELDRVFPENPPSSGDSPSLPPVALTPEGKLMYSVGYIKPPSELVKLVVLRQFSLAFKDTRVLLPRAINAVCMGLFYGSMFYHIRLENYIERVSIMVVMLSQVAFANMIDVGIMVETNPIIYNQSSWYPTWVYTLAATIASIPINLVETFVYMTLVYFMVFNTFTAPCYFTAYALLTVVTFCVGCWFRFLSVTFDKPAVVASMATLTNCIFVNTAGFFINKASMANWMLWLYYLSPFSWATRVLTNNEFSASRYDRMVPLDDADPLSPLIRLGDLYMKNIHFEQGSEWIGYGFLYILGFSILSCVLMMVFMKRSYYELSIGTRRLEDEDDPYIFIDQTELSNPLESNPKNNPNNNTDILSSDTSDVKFSDIKSSPFIGTGTPNTHIKGRCDNEDETEAEDADVDIDADGDRYEDEDRDGDEVNDIIDGVETGDGEDTDKQHTEHPDLEYFRDSISKASTHYNKHTLHTLREALPFQPTWMSFSHIKYTVQVQKDGQTVDKLLLNDISGYFEPGKLTALMGASGAGKTTLLDVLAGRKSAGVIEGTVMLNGRVPSLTEIANTTGYVEQFDSLFLHDSVKETLLFSARLRLPSSVSEEVKETIVDEVLDVLELSPFQDFLLNGLSPSQLKRVNIGVELVTNPSVIFLDEPTTGLDSKAAQTVMRVVKRIARSGRAIICTIHQPSAELAFLFDRLVLLGSGGHQIFFGDVGYRFTKFIKYLESVPGTNPCPPRHNPASWMLEELGIGVFSTKQSKDIDESPKEAHENSEDEKVPDTISQLDTIFKFKNYYFKSRISRQVFSRLNALETLSGVEEDIEYSVSHNTLQKERDREPSVSYSLSVPPIPLPTADSVSLPQDRPSFLYQYLTVQKRQFMSYWRDPGLIYYRLFIMIFNSILYSCLYYGLTPYDTSTSIAAMSSRVMSLNYAARPHCGVVLPIFIMNRAIYYRERSSNMYHPLMPIITGLINEIVWTLLDSLFFVNIIYWMLGFKQDAGAYFGYLFCCFFFSYIFVVIAALISSVSSSFAVAQVIEEMMYNTMSSTQGINLRKSIIPAGYKWLFEALATSHISHMIIDTQFSDSYEPVTVLDGTITKTMSFRDYVVFYTSFQYGEYGMQFLYAFLFFFTVLVAALLANHFIHFSNR